MPDLTYAQLAAEIDTLGKDIARHGDEVTARAVSLSEEAKSAAAEAQAIAALSVDAATVGEAQDLVKILDALSASCTAYGAAGDYAVKQAKAAGDQNTASHRAIGDAASRSTAGSDIYNVSREWLRQE